MKKSWKNFEKKYRKHLVQVLEAFSRRLMKELKRNCRKNMNYFRKI